MTTLKMQLGKAGLSPNFIGTLKNAFKTHTVIKIAVHQHKEQTKKDAEEIVEKLGKKFTYKIVGFTIIVQKWRKDRR